VYAPVTAEFRVQALSKIQPQRPYRAYPAHTNASTGGQWVKQIINGVAVVDK
jgi:hypothetical protein